MAEEASEAAKAATKKAKKQAAKARKQLARSDPTSAGASLQSQLAHVSAVHTSTPAHVALDEPRPTSDALTDGGLPAVAASALDTSRGADANFLDQLFCCPITKVTCMMLPAQPSSSPSTACGLQHAAAPMTLMRDTYIAHIGMHSEQVLPEPGINTVPQPPDRTARCLKMLQHRHPRVTAAHAVTLGPLCNGSQNV